MFKDHTTYAPLRLFEYDHKPGHFCLMITDTDLLPLASVFAQGGRQASGYGFADLTLQVVRSTEPALEQRFGMDPEAGMFIAYSEDLTSLQKLAALLQATLQDHTKLAAAVAAAPYEYD